METKKNKEADLESCHLLFLEIGLVCAMGGILLAFHWKVQDQPVHELATARWIPYEEESVPIMRPTQPPPPSPSQHLQQLTIVENQAEVSEAMVFDVEATQETGVRVYEQLVITPAEEPGVEDPEIFVVVEEMPMFPGGEPARIDYLSKILRYPRLAMETGIEGTVFLTFVVEEDGSISGVRVLRGIGGGCDEEAIRVVKSMPKWIPGKQRGIPVKVHFNMPVRFILNG
ncbi:MAG: energy transducer TonB [Bacteroidales bacterium]